MDIYRCDLCGSHAYAARERSIVQCSGCSLIATWPQPTDEDLQNRYEGGYYTGWDGSGSRGRLWKRRLAIVRRYLRSGRILDVGCGSGEFLACALEGGFDAAGTEFSAAARSLIRLCPVYERPEDAPGLWDAITIWHVLEHTRSPSRMLESLRQKLKPDGHLFVAVPNVESYWFDAVYRLIKGHPPALYTEDAKEPHLFHFSTRTLRKCVEKCGFKIIDERLDAPDPDLRRGTVELPARLFSRIFRRNYSTAQLVVAVRG